jgi:hypothetical protein
MFPPHLIAFSINRAIVTANLAQESGGGDKFQKLIRNLSLEELYILRQEKSLINRIVAITKMDADDLREHMVKKWNLTVESCMNDDWWVDIEVLRRRYPKWARAIVEGHYLKRDRFEEWGHELLMEEVHVNINIKRIQNLRKAAKEKQAKKDKALEAQWEELVACGYYGC